ncbi:rod-binding protein [Selenomonas sputigena]|uniref:rod-binding protein n=1 Tax=Selenomonas sputigena TaxID=69823 RepID=UPI0028F14C6C|nr:rod-binding protein [Selenomonas sputigena]
MQIFDALHADALHGQGAANSSLEQAKERADSAQFSDKLKEAQKSLSPEKGQKTQTSADEAAANKKLMDACKGFEAMFLDIMYRQMRQTVPKDTLFGHDNTDDILESMRDTAMVEKMSEAGGIGLAKTLYEQLQREAHSIKVDA